MMNYQEAIDFLFHQFPVFEKTGALAYKPGLERIEELTSYFDNPHTQFKSIHIAGTNGKGSSSHMIASVLQASGYKVGLFTSPHLLSFTERIRVNGIEIPQEEVTTFVQKNIHYFKKTEVSFFEITTLMAFFYFASQKVDIAVLETGMGGRLDATNIVQPILSLITNISMDHKQFLGNTIGEIASEKAGIIKKKTPIIVSELQNDSLVVFKEVAQSANAPLHLASEECSVENVCHSVDTIELDITISRFLKLKKLTIGLAGFYQEKNIKGVAVALRELDQLGFSVSETAIRSGLARIKDNTGLKGRWQVVRTKPTVIFDTAHNEAGIAETMKQLATQSYKNLYIVLGILKDKEIDSILSLFPIKAYYLFTNPSTPRALTKEELYQKAIYRQLNGELVNSPAEALQKAIAMADVDDFIYVGGSNFVVAEVMSFQ